MTTVEKLLGRKRRRPVADGRTIQSLCSTTTRVPNRWVFALLVLLPAHGYACNGCTPFSFVSLRVSDRTTHMSIGKNSNPQQQQQVLLNPQQRKLLQPNRREIQKRVYDTAKTNTSTSTSARKPKGYWKSVENIRTELRDQWEVVLALGDNCCDETTTTTTTTTAAARKILLNPPPIPSESLLNYWNRHDLRNAIRSFGGRRVLGDALEAHVLPGKWKAMVREKHPLVVLLLERDPNLCPERAPVSKQQLKRLRSKRYNLSEQDLQAWMQGSQRWKHRNNYYDRERLYKTWSKDTVVAVLCDYLKWRKRTKGIPSVWMPRLSEFERNDDGDDDESSFGFLKNAICNHYGYSNSRKSNYNDNDKHISGVELLCAEVGLVPYAEWKFIEGQHDLMVSLKKHIDARAAASNDAPDYSVFPEGYSTEWRTNGNKRLFHLVKEYGGRDFVAARFGMDTSSKYNWGPLDLEFGISLMEYVRLIELQKEPSRVRLLTSATSNKPTAICMPLQSQLLSKSKSSPSSILMGIKTKTAATTTATTAATTTTTWGEYLHDKIVLYGGYENVARRLGLEWRQR